MSDAKLESHRLKNWLHSAVLILAMGAILALVGWFLAGMSGLLVAAGFGLLSALVSPRMSPKLMLRLYRARPVSRREAPGLYAMVRRLADRADLEHAPELFMIPSSMLNAMTVGRPRDAVIGVTDGLLRNMDREETRAILAHEIAHLASGDTRVMAIADAIAQLTNTMSTVGKLLLFINLPLILVGAVTVPWTVVAVLILAPVASGLLQLALSRTREFDADANAVRLTGDPEALVRGLKKLETYNESMMKHLLAPGYGRPEPSLLRTHPHTERRIERLRQLDTDAMEPPEGTEDVEVHRGVERVDRGPRWHARGLWF
ncbi:MAG: zinc metalloprotease HtpX [Bradymonadaceae bacterium]